MINVSEKSSCCGCSACSSRCSHGAIKMLPDNEGFLYPVVSRELCVDCGLCETVCPIIYRDNKIEQADPIDILAVRTKDRNVLFQSSSGGFFSILYSYVIKQGGVVFGVRYNEEMEVVHSFSETLEGCIQFRGSKYVQSNIVDIYAKVKAFLKNNRLVLFTGTPCQVEGLNMFLRKRYDNLITTDLLCHGAPSPKVFKDYVNYINQLYGDTLVNLNMRYKGGRGWGHRFSYLYTFSSGKQEVDWDGIKDWGRLYFRDIVNRPSCYECRFCSYDRPGDFSMADFWDDTNKHPELFDKDGTSLVFVNTNKAQQLLQLFDTFESTHITKEDAYQQCLKTPFKCNEAKRKEHWKYYHKHGFKAYYWRFYCDSMYMRRKKFIAKTKSIIKKFLYNEQHK